MSNEQGPPEKATTQEAPRPDELGNTTKLIITYYRETGRVEVFGPIDDQLLSYGLLKVAEQQIHRHNALKQRELEKGGLTLPPPGFRLPRA
jgi:hypothetical protein